MQDKQRIRTGGGGVWKATLRGGCGVAGECIFLTVTTKIFWDKNKKKNPRTPMHVLLPLLLGCIAAAHGWALYGAGGDGHLMVIDVATAQPVRSGPPPPGIVHGAATAASDPARGVVYLLGPPYPQHYE